MKKLIRGKRYNTSTATVCGSYTHKSPSDFDYVCETLYRKQTGEYFLHGEGGVRTVYAARGESGWTGGEKIIPYTLEKAQKWAEEHLKSETYEEIFGPVDEFKDKYRDKVSQTLRLSGATIELLKRAASTMDKPLSEVADDILFNALNERKDSKNMDMDKILKIIDNNEDKIKGYIKKLMDEDGTYPIDVLYCPRTEDLEFQQDDGSWVQNDDRTHLFTIKPGMVDDHYLTMRELEHLDTDDDEEYKYVSLFDFKSDEAIDYLNDLINEEYDLLIDGFKKHNA